MWPFNYSKNEWPTFVISGLIFVLGLILGFYDQNTGLMLIILSIIFVTFIRIEYLGRK